MEEGSMGAQTPPGYLRAAGAILALWFIGGTLVEYLSLPHGSVTTMSVIVALLGGASGLGLVVGWKWSWFTSLGLALVGLIDSWTVILQVWDISQSEVITVGMIVLFVRSVLLLAALLVPRSMRWLRRRPAPREHAAPS
jgi:hypothetical protein